MPSRNWNSGKPIRAVFLDVDDTLYPERDYVISGIDAVSEFLASHSDVTLGVEKKDISARLLTLLDEKRGDLFDRMRNLLGFQTPSVSTLVHVYRTHRPTLSLCSDVVPALDRLTKAGIRLGIITDGKATVQRKKIEALGLGQLVETIICSDDLLAGSGKPSTVPFEVALCYLQVTPDEAIYIGDDLSKDFIGPRRLGMRTIRIDRSLPHPLQPRTDFPESHQADITCRDLSEAAGWLLKSFEDR